MELSSSTVLRPHPDAAFRIVDGTAVIVLARDAKMLTLNKVGTRIWELLDGRTLGGVAETLVQEFEVEADRAKEDAVDFARTLVERGLVEVAEAE